MGLEEEGLVLGLRDNLNSAVSVTTNIRSSP